MRFVCVERVVFVVILHKSNSDLKACAWYFVLLSHSLDYGSRLCMASLRCDEQHRDHLTRILLGYDIIYLNRAIICVQYDPYNRKQKTLFCCFLFLGCNAFNSPITDITRNCATRYHWTSSKTATSHKNVGEFIIVRTQAVVPNEYTGPSHS